MTLTSQLTLNIRCCLATLWISTFRNVTCDLTDLTNLGKRFTRESTVSSWSLKVRAHFFPFLFMRINKYTFSFRMNLDAVHDPTFDLGDCCHWMSYPKLFWKKKTRKYGKFSKDNELKCNCWQQTCSGQISAVRLSLQLSSFTFMSRQNRVRNANIRNRAADVIISGE